MINRYYRFGHDAYHMGLALDDNPYTPGSAPHASWEAGHTDAWYESTFGEESDKS